MSKEKVLTTQQLNDLRSNGTISQEEIAILEGDILLAKNVLTLERRMIGKANEVLTEGSERKILKG